MAARKRTPRRPGKRPGLGLGLRPASERPGVGEGRRPPAKNAKANAKRRATQLRKSGKGRGR